MRYYRGTGNLVARSRFIKSEALYSESLLEDIRLIRGVSFVFTAVCALSFLPFPCRLMNCGITDEGYVALASAVSLNPMSNLRELNLNRNKPGDRGVKMLSDLLKDTNCKLKTL